MFHAIFLSVFLFGLGIRNGLLPFPLNTDFYRRLYRPVQLTSVTDVTKIQRTTSPDEAKRFKGK